MLAAASADGGLTEEQRLTIERNKTVALARRKNRLSAAPHNQPLANNQVAMALQPRKREEPSTEPAGPQPVANRSGLFFNRNREATVKTALSSDPKLTGTAVTVTNVPAKPWHQFKQIT